MGRVTPSPAARLLVLAAFAAGACAQNDGDAPRPPAPNSGEPAPADAAKGPWLDPRGTSIVGFGLLRVVPEGGRAAVVGIRYREIPDGYSTTGNLQLFVLSADAFAKRDRAFAGDFLALARTEDEAKADDDYALKTSVSGI